MNKNILFITGCYPKEFNDFYIDNSKVMPQNAANVLSWRIIEGLQKNVPHGFKVLTCPFIGYFPNGFKKLLIKDAEWKVGEVINDQLGFINIKGLETFIKSERIYRYVRRWYKASENNRAILLYSHYAGFLRAAGKIRRRMPDMHISCLVTDMNELDERKDLQGLKGKIKGIPRQIMINTTYKNLKHISSFVLLAEKMKEYLGVGDRPYVIVEGICDSAMDPEKIEFESVFPKEKNEFRVVYTGTLHKRYGVVTLARAFQKLQDKKNVSLYICGSGDGLAEVEEISRTTESVHFLGTLAHSKALSLQKSADLLVNSMPNFGIHTALSFPSKTMEYMVMGRPVACFKVDGIPDEYDDYLMYFEEYTADSMAERIAKIAGYSSEKLQEIAERNKNFAKAFKCPQVQVEKIVNLLEGN